MLLSGRDIVRDSLTAYARNACCVSGRDTIRERLTAYARNACCNISPEKRT